MGDRGFKSILLEKMTVQREKKAISPPIKPSLHDPSFEVWTGILRGFSNDVMKIKKPVGMAYARPTPPSQSETKPPRSPGVPLQITSALQRESLEFFQNLGELRLVGSQTDVGLVKAFRVLAKKYHPDSHFAKSQGDLGSFNEMFRRVREAYGALRDSVAK